MLMCSITIHSVDPLYLTAIEFLTEKGFLQGSMSQMKAQLKKKKWVWWWLQSKEENKKPDIEFLPGPGNHIFKFKGRTLWAR